MLIPESVCTELTSETANRLQDGGSFVAYSDMDSSAQEYLQRNRAEASRKDARAMGGLKPRKTSLARAILFFVRDPNTDILYSVPWIRSPQGSRHDYHFSVITDFQNTARGKYPALDTTTFFESQPEAVNGIVARSNATDTLLGLGLGMLPDEHAAAVERSQQALAEAGAPLHVKIGYTLLLQAGDVPAAPLGFVERCGRALKQLY